MQIKFGLNQTFKKNYISNSHIFHQFKITKLWLPPAWPKAPFIIGAFSDLIWNSRTEIPHLDLLNVLECAHEVTQWAIVPALLVPF